MYKAIRAIFIIIFASLSILAQSQITLEEYKIYAKLLSKIEQENRTDYGRKTYFVILDKTVSPEEELLDGRPIKIRSLAKNFKSLNDHPAALKLIFPINFNYVLVDKKQIDALLDRGEKEAEKERQNLPANTFQSPGAAWAPFYQKFGDNAVGFYSFSRIAFSKDKRTGAVVVNNEDSWRGFSQLYLLKKIKGKWKMFPLVIREAVS